MPHVSILHNHGLVGAPSPCTPHVPEKGVPQWGAQCPVEKIMATPRLNAHEMMYIKHQTIFHINNVILYEMFHVMHEMRLLMPTTRVPIDSLTPATLSDECLKHSYYTRVSLAFSCCFGFNYIVLGVRSLI